MEFQFFGNLPPEIQEQIAAHMDKEEMQTTDQQHEIYRNFEEMPLETLKFLRGFLMRVTDDPTGAFFVGYITGILATWYGICPACGKNHDEELAKVVGGADVPDDGA
jgi:hypothetical protein